MVTAMNDGLTIRAVGPDDGPAIEALTRHAFPDEDLVPLVRDLMESQAPAMSLLARIDGRLAGYVFFAACGIDGSPVRLALLGPLAVAPDMQRQGIGSQIVRAGLEQQAESGVARVLVLGDPNYYARFAFVAETDVLPPYALPAEWRHAWQSLVLTGESEPLAGQLSVPKFWRHKALWAPEAAEP
jgi:putative acetyltransferase